MRSYEEIAYLLMVALKRSGKARYRLSHKSLQKISGRDVIRPMLVASIAEWMEGEAVLLPLNRGGYVVVSQESLEGIAPLKFAEIVPEWQDLQIEALRAEVGHEDVVESE